MEGERGFLKPFTGSTHTVANNSSHGSIVVGEEFRVLQVRGVQILRSVREEIEPCDIISTIRIHSAKMSIVTQAAPRSDSSQVTGHNGR